MYVYDADEKDFAKQLVGRSIRKVTDDTITLDNGVKLKIINHSSCCASFKGVVELIDFNENVITRVTRKNKSLTAKERAEARARDTEVATRWSVNIYSANRKIARVNMETALGTGHYGSSINLEIVS